MFEIKLSIKNSFIAKVKKFIDQYSTKMLIGALGIISVGSFIYYLNNGLGLSYNDARSHLDIGRRVVEGLKPGFAQLGSVWLPLPHLLMVPTIWNDFMWHTGLSGAIQSMISFVVTGVVIFYYLKELKVSLMGRLLAVLLFVANINILYLQSTAMTELLLLATILLGSFHLLKWVKYDAILQLILASFWIMLSTLIRYDGWFMFFYAAVIVVIYTLKKRGYKATEGTFVLFCTLGGFGIFGWLLWNWLIFKDPLYFAFGPFSAHAQQTQLESAGVLATKSNLLLSLKVYWYAMMYNSGGWTTVLGIFGSALLFLDKNISGKVKLAVSALWAPFMFNIIALYLGHSVLFVQGLIGGTWFNARYGIMLMPSLAIFIGYLFDRLKNLRYLLVGTLLFVLFFTFNSSDAVTIDDATVGSSQKNVSEVSGWLNKNAKDKEGFILISAASHDAIIFSSGLPMKKFIHEGTGAYWESASEAPDRWARWIVMRTNDLNDLTFKAVVDAPGLVKYQLVDSYPFADIYQLKDEYLEDLNITPVYGKQK